MKHDSGRPLMARVIREHLRLGLREAARRAGINYSWLSLFETGQIPHPDLSIVRTLARFYGVTMEALTEMAPTRQPDEPEPKRESA